MSYVSAVYAALFSVAILWCAVASVWRLVGYFRTPQPFPIALMPAPATRTGVSGRLLLELFVFRSLWRAGKAGWVASIAFHYGLLGMLMIHLRFVFPALPGWLIPLILVSGYLAALLVAGLVALLWRRLSIDRLRYISAPSDYLHLILLLSIALSGVWLKRYWPAELGAVGQFMRGLFTVHWQPLPDNAALVLHLSLVLVLLFIFPVSKLLHGPGLLFSPTFTQRDTGRSR